MSLTVAVLQETHQNEPRVAAIPETVKKLTGLNVTCLVTSGAGQKAAYEDKAYKDAGASIVKTNNDAVAKADIIFCVRTPDAATVAKMKKGAVVIGQLSPFTFQQHADTFKKGGLSAVAMELMPRITRAQNLDVLSSQSNLAGYRAVIEASNAFTRAFPMMMTAAGTVPPAKAFIMGAGVAGLQAIATAKRLGASVSATDVRMAAKEQVQSLGAKFIMVEDDETAQAETSGGYAKEMSAAYQKKQAALIAETIAKQDIVITTALIPGRPAPVLVTEDMVKSMKPGSVIVDLAAAQGGNCPLTVADKVIVKHGVTIIGYTNLAGHVATDASALYARNLFNFISLFIDKDKGNIDFDRDSEIAKAVMLVENGKAAHDILAPKPAAAAPKKASAKKAAAKKKTAVKKTASKATAKSPSKAKGSKA